MYVLTGNLQHSDTTVLNRPGVFFSFAEQILKLLHNATLLKFTRGLPAQHLKLRKA